MCVDAQDITDGSQITVTDSSHKVIGTGTLVEDNSAAAQKVVKEYDTLQVSLGGSKRPRYQAPLRAVYAIQFQTHRQKAGKAYKVSATLYCSVCGKPVSVRRRPSLGRPVYCRDKG